MGRIAEALKRAQQERQRRLREDEPSGPARGDESLGGEIRLPGRRSRAPSGADPADRSPIIEAPSLPPLPPVRGEPIERASVDAQVVALHDPHSEIAEKYRSVRTRLLTSNPTGGARIFAVTSTLPREGKTVTTANLGFSLSELRHLRVAMVDLDFRQRGLSGLFHAGDRPGIAEVLNGSTSLGDVCARTVRDNLFLLPAGNPGDEGASELIAGTRAAALVKELHERFHYTIVDTPPVNTNADIGLIAPLCHSVLVVIRMNRTPERLLRRSVRLLKANKVSIAGCILAGYCDATMGYTDPHDYYEDPS